MRSETAATPLRRIAEGRIAVAIQDVGDGGKRVLLPQTLSAAERGPGVRRRLRGKSAQGGAPRITAGIPLLGGVTGCCWSVHSGTSRKRVDRKECPICTPAHGGRPGRNLRGQPDDCDQGDRQVAEYGPDPVAPGGWNVCGEHDSARLGALRLRGPGRAPAPAATARASPAPRKGNRPFGGRTRRRSSRRTSRFTSPCPRPPAIRSCRGLPAGAGPAQATDAPRKPADRGRRARNRRPRAHPGPAAPLVRAWGWRAVRADRRLNLTAVATVSGAGTRCPRAVHWTTLLLPLWRAGEEAAVAWAILTAACIAIRPPTCVLARACRWATPLRRAATARSSQICLQVAWHSDLLAV